MITDVVGAEKALYRLHNAYVRRAGEICSRGPVRQTFSSSAATSGSYFSHVTQCEFHSEMGTLAAVQVRLAADNSVVGQNIMAAVLQGSAQAGAANPTFTWTSLGSSTSGLYVPTNATGTYALIDEIVSMTRAQNEIFMGGSLGRVYKWAGATATIASGTAVAASSVSLSSTTAVPSNIVTFGTAINVTAVMEPGSYVMIDGVGENNTISNKNTAYRITNIDGQNVELEYPLYVTGTMNNLAWVSTPLALVGSPSGVWNGADEYPRIFGPVAYHQGRLFVAGPSNYRTDYNSVYDFSSIQWSYSAGTTTAASRNRAHVDMWGAGAWQPIYPGTGGAIRGLVSMGDELVIIKTHAIFSLSGEVADDGGNQNLNASVRLVQDGPGANGFRAWKLTKAGLLIAGQDGLYLYDGQSVKSLTDGRIQRWWEDNFRTSNYAITVFDDKAIISQDYAGTGSGTGTSLVWDIEKDYFWTISHRTISCGAPVFTNDDRWVGDIAFPAHGVGNGTGREFSWQNWSDVTHKNGQSIPGRHTAESHFGVGSTYAQDPIVQTNVIPLGEDQVSEGRVNNVLITGSVDNDNSDEVVVSIESGMTSDGTNGYFASEGAATTTTGAYGIPDEDSDKVYRIPFDGNPAAAGVKVTIGSDADVARGFRIYAIGVDYTPSNVVS